jgi:uncharacterized oligopeptide transporter (OPT) family protein
LGDTAHDKPAAPWVRRFLPEPGSRKYHVLLAAAALLFLGPLGGVTSAYMTFSLGFTVGAQVLAGILGSTVTYGYGAEGKHGANYIQTMAASVASMAGMCVLMQAMVWLGMPLPAGWKIAVYFGCIGMFGIGVGMMYTPILVDRLQLEYPSGHAVANILRALTDPRLLRRSIGKLGGGAVAGVAIAAVMDHLEALDRLVQRVLKHRVSIGGLVRWLIGLTRLRWLNWTGVAVEDLAAHLSASTVGAGLIVGSRIGVPAAVLAGIGALIAPSLRRSGMLGPQDPFRKIGFLIGLAMIFGAAIVDLAVIGADAVRRVRAARAAPAQALPSGGLSMRLLVLWVGFWGVAVTLVAALLLHQPVGFTLFALALVFLFVFVNGISDGISDWNPISSAFVVSVLMMSALGLRSPTVAITAASILLITCTVGVDMQQDRSTGWRLGSDRAIQFRYQAVGIVVGAVLCVVFALVFLNAYPVLRVDTYTHPEALQTDPAARMWQSAMTFKFVGAIRSLGDLPPFKVKLLCLGLGIGFVTEVLRKLLRRWAAYRTFVASGAVGFSVGWLLDAVILPSPYASSTGGFLDFSTAFWFAFGSVLTSLFSRRRTRPAHEPPPESLPEDMSTPSLIGGGLIAGESIYILAAALVALAALRWAK